MKSLSRLLFWSGAPLIAACLLTSGFAQDSDQITSGDPTGKYGAKAPNVHQTASRQLQFGIPYIDSIQNFNGEFTAPGYDPNGNPNTHWYTNTVGLPPELNRTTFFTAPIVPVALDMRNYDGSPRFVNGHRLYLEPPNVPLVVNSPIFQNYAYTSSSVPTQYTDAVQRAEFYDRAGPQWHTILKPGVRTTRPMVLIRGTYRFALNPDGSCCRYVLVDENAFGNALFPATADDTTTPVGAAENAGEVTTKQISTFLFNNVFLTDSQGGCCILGYHTYDVEPGTIANGNVEKRYVLNYSSWVSPGLFGSSFADITPMSHELSETFNDPFVTSDGVHNITPWWRSPNGLCQDNVEDGDVIEGLPNATFPILMNGFLYHPQNEALLSYFKFQVPSTAIGGAYSYPDTTVLTGPSTPQRANCQ